MILVLGAQRLMAPIVVCFLSENFFSLLRLTILLCRKRLIVKSITGNQNRIVKLAKSCGGKFFKNFKQKSPGKDIQDAPRTQDRKKIKIMLNSHATVATKWLPGWKQVPLNCPASRIKKASITFARGFYSIKETKNLPTCVEAVKIR